MLNIKIMVYNRICHNVYAHRLLFISKLYHVNCQLVNAHSSVLSLLHHEVRCN